MTRDHHIDQLRDAIVRRKDVLLAYLFGSHATGTDRPASDVDVAILCDDALSAGDGLELQIGLALEAGQIFGTRADVVLLNQASPFLRHQVLKHGRLIHEGAPGLDSALRFKTMTDYFESAALQNFFYARIIERRGHG